MSNIIFPKYSDGILLFGSLLESRHFFNSFSKSELFTNGLRFGRGFIFSYSARYFCRILDFSRFFFWNSSSDSFFLLGMVYVSFVLLGVSPCPLAEVMVNTPFTRLCLNYTNFRNRNQSNMPLILWLGFFANIEDVESMKLSYGSSSSILVVFGTPLVGVLYIPNRWGSVNCVMRSLYCSISSIGFTVTLNFPSSIPLLDFIALTSDFNCRIWLWDIFFTISTSSEPRV